MSWKPDIVVYHAHCNDGFTAAWVAKTCWPDEDIQYIPASHGDPEPAPDITNKNLLILDFSYDATALERLGAICRSCVILDHHETARDALAAFLVPLNIGEMFIARQVNRHLAAAKAAGGFPVLAHFDMAKSGATLAWDFCFPEKMTPFLVRYVEDHDLYRHELPGAQEFSMALGSYPRDFVTWNGLALKNEDLIAEGAHILRAFRAGIENLLPYIVHVKIGEHAVPCLNLPPNMASLGGQILLEAFDDVPFVATFFSRGARDQWSLRSKDGGAHVGEIARRFGGGGHPRAAGFHIRAGGAETGTLHEGMQSSIIV